MKDFTALSSSGQFRRLRQMAKSALPAYGLAEATLTALTHFENTTFRVDVDPMRDPHTVPTQDWKPSRYLLRIHSPIYHTPAEIASELMWLDHLYAQGIVVPIAVSTLSGAKWQCVEVPGVPQPRVCTLMRWVEGRFIRKRRPLHMHRVGQLLGAMHELASRYQPPAHFTRRTLDIHGMCRDSQGQIGAAHIWGQRPQSEQDAMRRAFDHIDSWMRHWGQDPDQFGLIHQDLHVFNVTFDGPHTRPIDFDDMGFGYFLHDLAVVLFQERFRSAAHRDALFAGYQEHMALPPQVETRLKVMYAASFLALLCWVLERSLDHPGIREQQERYAARAMLEFEQLPTPPSL